MPEKPTNQPTNFKWKQKTKNSNETFRIVNYFFMNNVVLQQI